MTRNYRIRWRRGTAALWSFMNPVLDEGEAGLETDTGKFKIGNGVDAWNDLGYAGGELADDAVDTAAIQDGAVTDAKVTGPLSANARVGVRKNSAGSTFTRRRVNLIEGTNVTLTVADDSNNEEVDVTISATGGGSVGSFSLLTDGDLEEPELVFADGDVIVTTF